MIARYAVAFFLLMAIVVVPIVVFLLCRYFLPRRWGKKVGVVLSLLIIMLALYGMFVGYQDLEITCRYYDRQSPVAHGTCCGQYFSTTC